MRSLPLFGLLIATALTALASDSHVRVNASRALQVCIVDNVKATPLRAALHRETGSALARALSAQAGETVEVRVEAVDSRLAATRLTDGNCDAVLVFGANRPRALQRLEVVALAGNLGPDRNNEPLSLMVGGDATLARLLATGFPAALTILAPPREAIVATR